MVSRRDAELLLLHLLLHPLQLRVGHPSMVPTGRNSLPVDNRPNGNATAATHQTATDGWSTFGAGIGGGL